MAIAAGTRFGSFEILSLLGAGGMGEVYRARDPRLNREVALKVLPEAFTSDPERLTRLRLSEADLPNALDNESGAQRRGLHVPDDQPPENWDADEDYQLKRAMDFLRQGTVAERLRARAG